MINRFIKSDIDYKSFISILIVFISIFIYFSFVHTIVVADGDDWTNLSAFRFPILKWGDFEPTRLLSKIICLIVGYVSAFVVKIFVNDYLLSITYCTALIMAILITLYFSLFKRFLINSVHFDESSSLISSFIFIIIHFGIFKSLGNNNIYMFYASNLTCYYFYTMPALLNCCFVLYLMGCNNFASTFYKTTYLYRGWLILLLYLLICSNIFHSIILVAYCGAFIVIMLLDKYDITVEHIYMYIKENNIYLLIILFWIIVLLFEMSGGRAVTIGNQNSFFNLPIIATSKKLFELFALVDKRLVFLSLSLILGGFILRCSCNLTKDFKSIFINIKINLVSFLLVTLFLILVSAKANIGYASRIEAMYGIFFYLFLINFIVFALIIKKYSRLQILLPFLWMFILMFSINPDKPFRESNMLNIPPTECMNISRSFIIQIQEAEQNGRNEIVLNVPKGDDNDNWPYPFYMGSRITHTLIAHGLINKNINIIIKPDKNMNSKF